MLSNEDKQIKAFFEDMIWQKTENGSSFVLAVYKTLGEFLEVDIRNSEVKLACKKGCSFCCHQLVTCTKVEIDEIIIFINRMERNAQRILKRRLEKSVKKWQEYFQQNRDFISVNPFQHPEKALEMVKKVHTDWMDKQPCPFLNQEGFCDIYSVRPIDCWTVSSLITCTSFKEQEGCKRFRFPCEWWANNMIAEAQQARFSYMAVSPLYHWLFLFSRSGWQPIDDREVVMD